MKSFIERLVEKTESELFEKVQETYKENKSFFENIFTERVKFNPQHKEIDKVFGGKEERRKFMPPSSSQFTLIDPENESIKKIPLGKNNVFTKEGIVELFTDRAYTEVLDSTKNITESMKKMFGGKSLNFNEVKKVFENFKESSIFESQKFSATEVSNTGFTYKFLEKVLEEMGVSESVYKEKKHIIGRYWQKSAIEREEKKKEASKKNPKLKKVFNPDDISLAKQMLKLSQALIFYGMMKKNMTKFLETPSKDIVKNFFKSNSKMKKSMDEMNLEVKEKVLNGIKSDLSKKTSYDDNIFPSPKEAKFSIFNWTLPAYSAVLKGVNVCTQAADCVNWCYALSGQYISSNSIANHHQTLMLTLTDEFVPSVVNWFRSKTGVVFDPTEKVKAITNFEKNFNKANLKKIKKSETAEFKSNDKVVVVRIHDSGDFYNLHYLSNWIAIMHSFPNVIFYFYTKQLGLAVYDFGHNIVVTHSRGSKADKAGFLDELINKGIKFKRTEMFPNKDMLDQYEGQDKEKAFDNSEVDYGAFIKNAYVVGLIAHSSNYGDLLKMDQSYGKKFDQTVIRDPKTRLVSKVTDNKTGKVLFDITKTPERMAERKRLEKIIEDLHEEQVNEYFELINGRQAKNYENLNNEQIKKVFADRMVAHLSNKAGRKPYVDEVMRAFKRYSLLYYTKREVFNSTLRSKIKLKK